MTIFDAKAGFFRVTPEQRTAHLADLASRPKDLAVDQAAAVAAGGTIADRIFKEARRATMGAVLGAYIDARKDGGTYDVEAIVRETALRVAQEVVA
jgi:hypothetical protein